MFSNDSDVCTISASAGCAFICIFTFGMSLTAVLFCWNNSFLTDITLSDNIFYLLQQGKTQAAFHFKYQNVLKNHSHKV